MNLRASERKAERIKQIIATCLITELSNPMFDFVSISSVKVDKNLNIATVLFTCINHPPEEVAKQLKNASGLIKKKLFHALQSKNTPDLVFKEDKGLAHFTKIQEIIASHNK